MVTYLCTKCGLGSRIECEGKDLHCRSCGNVVVDGVKPRWPIIEKESKEVIKMSNVQSPETRKAALEEVGKGPLPWAKAQEIGKKYGVSATTIYNWLKKAQDQNPPRITAQVNPPTKPVPSRLVVVDFTDYPEIYDAIKKEAQESFRTIDGQMLYHAHLLILAGQEGTT